MVLYIGTYGNMNLSSCQASNLNILGGKDSSISTLQYLKDCIGGIIGDATYVNMNLQNSKVENINLTNVGGYGHLGGIVGGQYYGIVNVEGCDANKVKLNAEQGQTIQVESDLGGGYGGIFGYVAYSNSKTIVRCNVSELEINSIYGYAGGIAGGNYDNGQSALNINESNVENAKISGLYAAGGIFGGDYSSLNINACNINNVELGNDGYGTVNAGGVVGFGKNTTITACKCTDLKIKGINNLGGIIGYTDSGMIASCSFEDSEISNIDYTEGKIYRNKQYRDKYTNIGGILGTSYEAVPIYSSTVNNSKINATTFRYGSRYENIGGIVGYAGYNNNSIAGCNVINSELIANHINTTAPIESYWSYNTNNLGGIVGYFTGKSGVMGCNIEGSKIKHIGTVNYATGGILGHATDNETTITGCNVKNTEIEGNGLVGGICSATAANFTIIGCKVKDSKITGTDRVGGILGMTYDGSANSDATLSFSYTTIENTKIKGRADYNYYIGWILPVTKTPKLTDSSYDAQTTLELVQ